MTKSEMGGEGSVDEGACGVPGWNGTGIGLIFDSFYSYLLVSFLLLSNDYLFVSEDVDARVEATIGGGARQNIQDAVKLTGG